MVQNKVVGAYAHPAGAHTRDQLIARAFLRDGMSIGDIARATVGGLADEQVQRSLAKGLRLLLPGRRQAARRYLHNSASASQRVAAYHALSATPAAERPSWLDDSTDGYLQHLAGVLRGGGVTVEDRSMGRRGATLNLLLECADPAAGLSLAKIAANLGVRAQHIGTQAGHSGSRNGTAPHPASVAKVVYFDHKTNLGDADHNRIRPIRCAFSDCPHPWADEVTWSPEVLAVGTGVICRVCRRPSKVSYEVSASGSGIVVRDVPAATWAVPRPA